MEATHAAQAGRRVGVEGQINFHQLYIFYTVARCRSFSRAAKELFISQPAVSIQVQELERSLSARLFQRLPRGLQLTDVGQTVLQYANRIFSLAADMHAEIGDIQGLRRGHLVVGAATTPGEALLPAAIGAFRLRYPGIAVEPFIGSASAVIERVHQREVDLALVPEDEDQGAEELAVEPYLTDCVILIAPPGHPLAGRAASIDEVAHEGVVLREAGSAARAAVDRAFAALGSRPRVLMELPSEHSVAQAVGAGLGLGAVSAFAANAHLRAGLVLPLEVAVWSCERRVVVIRRREQHLSSAQTAFLEVLRSGISPALQE